MINKQLLDPESIVIVGGSNDTGKPGGKVLKNLLDTGFKGEIFAVNPEDSEVQGVVGYKDVHTMPDADLAIIAVPPESCVEIVEVLACKKNTRAFIIISAGFSELNHKGKLIEERIASIIDRTGGVLIGPNVIGVLTAKYCGIFTEPVPVIDPQGVDFISGSGATAVFIIDTGIRRGLAFSGIFSVGNSAQTGAEDILKYMDESFDPEADSKIKILYLENIRKPDLLLKHASSLIRKGCSIAAVKAGSSDAGSRAASSHTGAIVTSDTAVDALFRKAGIVRCYSREELVTAACIFNSIKPSGKNFAVITHAGGPGVMLTDALTKNGLNVPLIKNEESDKLLGLLNPGSSVSNPVDFLATGTAEQLGLIMDFTEKSDLIDASVVIFGTPGLFKVYDVYDVLHEKMMIAHKPVYPVLPSVLNAADEIKSFTEKGHIYFPDEVLLGEALAKVYNTPGPFDGEPDAFRINKEQVRNIIGNAPPGYMQPESVQNLLDACGIPRAEEFSAYSLDEAFQAAESAAFPLAMKVIGPIHKSDVGGVSLNICSNALLQSEFDRMMKMPGVKGVVIQPMLSGTELFIGAKYEEPFGHLILCGAGGIFVELLNDTAAGMVPLNMDEALYMIRSLKSYKIFKGIRGRDPADENIFADIILRVSELLQTVPEISELDFNPLMAEKERIIVADARIKIG